MWQRELLFYISIMGPVIALAATVWGLSKETSTKTESGEKRLTRQGQISVALAVGSAMIGVTALGLGELVKRQDALAAAAAKSAEKNENRRRAADERRWQQFRLAQLAMQQRFLSDLQLREARRHAGEILASQQLFAAVEVQRDRGIVSGNRIFQIAQSQRIILQSQPLTSLHIQLTFGGFSAQEFAEFVDGQTNVAHYATGDDQYGRLRDLRPLLDNANMVRHVLGPAIIKMAGIPSREEGDSSVPDGVLVVDLAGEGSWVLPIGTTGQAPGRGFVLNNRWLEDAGRLYAHGDGAQEFGQCQLPSISLDPTRRAITVIWIVGSACLPTAIHKAADFPVTSRLANAPRIAIFRGPAPFPGEASNVTRGERATATTCWSGSAATGPRFIELVAVPNGNPSIGVRKTLLQQATASVDPQETSEDDPRHLGICTLFR